jgi:DNA-binding CsgD family transcriptional regulator/pimeloyl-ACP methyl ester carboxylesterase
LLWLADAFGSHTQLYREQPGVDAFFERLERGRTLIRVDCRGTGMSDRDCSDYSSEAITEDIARVLAELGIEWCDVFASGARHVPALRLALKRPGLVRKIVLNSPFPLPLDGTLVDFMTRNWPLFRELSIQRSTRKPLHEVRHILEFTARCVDQRDFLAMREARLPGESWRLAPLVTCPVLTMEQANCTLGDAEAGKKLAATFARGRLIELPFGTMIPPWGDPAPMVQTIEEFLGPTDEEPRGDVRVLTPREREVLRLLAEGRTQVETAAELVISPATVSRHVVSLYAKLGVHRRAEAVAWAVRNGVG